MSWKVTGEWCGRCEKRPMCHDSLCWPCWYLLGYRAAFWIACGLQVAHETLGAPAPALQTSKFEDGSICAIEVPIFQAATAQWLLANGDPAYREHGRN